MENIKMAKPKGFWSICRDPILLIIVGGAIDTIGFIALFGFFTAHVTGNLVIAGAAWVNDGSGIWIKLGAIPLFILTVAITKYWIDRSTQRHTALSYLFLGEALFLTGFMVAGLYFEPFKDANSVTVAITAGLGLIALAIRNTSSKTLIKHISPSTMMTGNTTQFGIDISNYLRNKNDDNKEKLLHSFSIVSGFVIGAFLGAFLYVYLDFWSVAFFIIPVLYLSYLAANKRFVEPD
ncbi:YoaK family protein [Acinetobacter piscicola]|uniref:YoaK family protein n=1 Tax=Acinetobacter piscicola TaxID=2006115 RepID=UPI000B7CA043|nr:YoaK family protein [Acinetobacter piscicola]